MKTLTAFYIAVLIFNLNAAGQGPSLKYVIYDFDGLDLGQTSLPDGDFKNFDLDYHVTSNPLSASEVLGDRVLQLDLNWASGTGEFGKGITRYIELNASEDNFNFYFLNPLSNYASALVDISIKEDDNQNSTYESSFDDRWVKTITIPRSANWQFISVPLNLFMDATTGGNGIFDAGYTNNNGKILTVSLAFHKSAAVTGPETYYTDMLCFSEGTLPTGNTILDLPGKDPADHCSLGCVAYRSPADSVPAEVERMLGVGNKLKFINIFMPFATTGTTASNLPGTSIQRLLNNNYRPIITWEMKYSSYPDMDSIQPRLINITNGSFDSYIDAFANRIKTFSDTIIMRLFHEFDGNWYPWSIEANGQDPANLINAYRYIVNRFNARGVTNVLWMWSPNSSPTPSAAYNWFVNAYPGDAYVDIVGTGIYNHPLPGIPPWKSFRYLYAESYYYLKKHFPSKPLYIAESACRERYPSEPATSQTKPEWICEMSRELQSYFSKTETYIFFNSNKEHNWRINSSSASLNAVKSCLWQNVYFNDLLTAVTLIASPKNSFDIFPNPFTDKLTIRSNDNRENEYHIVLYDTMGQLIYNGRINKEMIFNDLASGIYLLLIEDKHNFSSYKLVKE